MIHLYTPKPTLLFLDIDGVINSERTGLAFGTYPNYTGRLESINPELFDKVAVGMINQLLDYDNMHLVLSSAWRETVTADRCKHMLKTIGIRTDNFLGRTTEKLSWLDDCEDGQTLRSREIQHFLDNVKTTEGFELLKKDNLIAPPYWAPFAWENYLIIDDQHVASPKQMKHFVRTSMAEGFGFMHFQRCLKVLKEENPHSIPQSYSMDFDDRTSYSP